MCPYNTLSILVADTAEMAKQVPRTFISRLPIVARPTDSIIAARRVMRFNDSVFESQKYSMVATIGTWRSFASWYAPTEFLMRLIWLRSTPLACSIPTQMHFPSGKEPLLSFDFAGSKTRALFAALTNTMLTRRCMHVREKGGHFVVVNSILLTYTM